MRRDAAFVGPALWGRPAPSDWRSVFALARELDSFDRCWLLPSGRIRRAGLSPASCRDLIAIRARLVSRCRRALALALGGLPW
jgi:hypothetical protein